jgi:phosphoserine phosphatase
MLHGCWTEENRSALEELIRREHSHAPRAVFDWDNTCIRGDIADAVFHQLCEDLAFRFDGPGFWDWITEAGLEDRVSQTYERFCMDPDRENRLRLRVALEQTHKFLHDGEDYASAWAWDTGAFVGWREQEVRDYTQEVIARELTRPLQVQTIEHDGDQLMLARGLRMRPEMKELVEALQRAGWQVWVLSASPRWEVEAFAALYGIPPQRVVGMRREVEGDRITAVVGPPVCYSDGKLDAYRMFISRDEPPSIVAGDSLADWKTLESSAEARLLVEPAPAALRDFALWRKREGEMWLLQKFD